MAIKVLQVIDHLAYGGGQFSVKGIIENMDSEQCEMFVCELRPNPPTVAIKGKFINLRYGKYDPRTVLAIAGLCKKYEIDILHPQLSKSNISCLLASFICKTPVVIHERGWILFSPVYSFLLKLLHRRAAVIIANSQAVASELVSKASVKRHNIRVIYNPVDFKIFDPEKVSRKQSRRNLKISDEDFIIGFVGRLHKMKGVDILIKAMPMLLDKAIDCCLVLAGDGPEHESLEAVTTRLGIADRVIFLGMCDNVPEITAAFDVAVIPSRQEPFGRVAAELMRMKVPIVTSGAGGLSELVTDGETGLVTRENSPEEIAAAVERLADDEELRRQLAQRAYEFSERFDIKAHVKEIQKIYMELIEEAKGNGRKRKRHFL